MRSPSEFAQDHVPGAINLPVMSDAERAEIGTIYVQDSAFLARRKGAGIVARNVAAHLEGPLSGKGPDFQPLIYCWRGGQRSNAMATIFGQIGWRTRLIAGGYQAYRRLVQAALYDAAFPCRVIVLDGDTGTAKTDILNRLPERGAQILDLEGLANHRGSIFGARQDGQPDQKAFESALAERVRRLDPVRPVVVEAESSKIGQRVVPPALWTAMTAAPRIEIAMPLAARAEYCVSAYGDVIEDPARLEALIEALRRFHPRDVVAQWREWAEQGCFADLAADLMARHYDPRYARQRARQAPESRRKVDVADASDAALDAAADAVAMLVKSGL